MDSIVFLAVIASAIFQATWNFFAKKSSADKTSILAVGWFLLGLCLVPVTATLVDFSSFERSWIWYSMASAVIHAFYIALLGWGYNVGEISIIYPVARGLGILWTALASLFLGIHEFSTNGLLGILAIIAGVILIGHKAAALAQHRKAFFIAITVSLMISLYSLIDSHGAKSVPLAFYIMMMNGLTAVLVLPFLLKFAPAKAINVFKRHKKEAFFIAVGGSLSYVIILWAFRTTPVSYVAALREFSVVIASMLGLIFLKEEISKRKLIGIGLVTFGAIFLKWS